MDGTDVGPRSYLVDTGKKILRRNAVHLRNIPEKHEESSKEFVSDDENILVDNEILNESNTTVSENDNSPNEHCGLSLRKSGSLARILRKKRVNKLGKVLEDKILNIISNNCYSITHSISSYTNRNSNIHLWYSYKTLDLY